MLPHRLVPVTKSIVIVALALTIILFTGSLAPNAAAANATITEWTLPDGNSGPWGIGFGPNGKVWISENVTNRIGMLDPVTNTLKEWNIPTGGANPKFIYLKPSGSSVQVYFAEYGADKVGYFDNGTSTFYEWTLPSGAKPVDIAVDNTGNIWFTESGRDSIGEITPTSNTLTEYKLPATPAPAGTVQCGTVTSQLCPWGLALQQVSTISGTNTFIWFTELTNDVIGRLEAKSHALLLFNLKTINPFDYAPWDISLDSQGNALFTGSSNQANRISIIRNQTNTMADLTIPTAQAVPTSVRWDQGRALAWFTEHNAGKIASMDPSTAVFTFLPQVIPCTIGGTNPGSPDCSSGSSFTQSTASVATNTKSNPDNTRTVTPSLITTIPSQNTNQFSEYPLPTSISGPVQVFVDSSDNLWFTENNSAGNRIGFMTVVSAFNFGLSVSPSTVTVTQGKLANYTISISLATGSPVAVSLSISPIPPAGITYSFTPVSGTPTYTSTLALGTTSSTPPGTYPFTVVASGGGLTKNASINLIVTAQAVQPTFNFSLQVTGGSPASITAGDSASISLSVSLVGSATPQTVQLFASGQPSGVTASFDPANGLPPFTSALLLSSSSNTAAGTYSITITGTGGGQTHQATASLTITSPARDFSISVSPASLSIPQASSGSATVTVQSTGVFNDPVALATSNLPAGVAVSFTPNPLTPSAGGTATATVSFSVSRSVSTGSYTFSITGTGGSLTHDTSITIQVSGCLIATATYGSEVAPEVQFLRNFRDYQILHTFAGSSFMVVFNSWYYSFSPTVANYIATHGSVKTVMQFMLYPLIGALHVSSASYSMLAAEPEFAALVAGMVAGSLIGVIYLALPMSGLLWVARRRLGRTLERRVSRSLAGLLLTLIAGFVVSELLAIALAMIIVGTGIVLTSLLLGSLVPAFRLVEYAKNRR